jgi:hypothetical protein
MSVFPCGICQKRKPGKMATIYWAWFRADNVRVAYRQRSCADDFLPFWAEWVSKALATDASCPGCGGSVGVDTDATYATIYLPKRDPVEAMVPTCSACAVRLRNLAQVGAMKLEDRGGEDGGPRPPTSATSAWDALGIYP